MFLAESLAHFLDGLDLVQSLADDILFGFDRFKRFFAVPLPDEVLQAVFGIEAEDAPGRIVLGIIPDEDVKAVGVEDDRSLIVLFFQPIGVNLCLGAALFRADSGFLRFDNCQGLSVVIPENIVGVTDTAFSRLVTNFDLLANFFSTGAVGGNIPARCKQLLVDQPFSGGGLVKPEGIGCFSARVFQGLQFGLGLFGCFLLAAEFFHLLEKLLQFGLLGGKFFQGRLFFSFQFCFCVLRRRFLKGRYLVGVTVRVRNKIPASQVPGSTKAAERCFRVCSLAVGRLVPVQAYLVQGIQHRLGHGLDKGILKKKVIEVTLVGQEKIMGLVDVFHHLLGKNAEFDERACRISPGVMFGKSAEVGKFRPAPAQHFKIF